MTRVVVAGAALVAVLALAWNLLEQRNVLAGSNSVTPHVVVAAMAPGQELCIPGLEVPPRAAHVLVTMFGQGVPRPELRGTLTAASGRVTAVTAPSQEVTGRADGEFVAAGGGVPPGPATLCFESPGQLSVAGTGGVADTGPAPALDGAVVDGRVSVRYPELGQHSRLSRLPEIVERATRFKPVGEWAGWLALAAVLAGVVAAVVLVLRSASLAPRRVALAIAVVALVQAAAFAVLTPAFDGPDEPDHFAYVESLARSGQIADQDPASTRPAYSDLHGELLQSLRHRARVASALGKAIYTDTDEERYDLRARGLDAGNGGGRTIPTHSHSPLYYGLLGAGYWPGSLLAGEPGAQLGARLFNALGLIVIALCAFALVRELAPRRPELAAAAGLLIALQPELGFVSGVVNNDTGVNVTSALLVWLAVRAVRRPPDARLFALIGLLLAAGVLMKANGFFLAGTLATAGLGALVRHGRTALPAVLAAPAAFALVMTAYLLVAGPLDRDIAAPGVRRHVVSAVVAALVVYALAIPIRRGARAVALTALAAVAALVLLAVLGDATPAGAHLDRARNAFAYIWQIFLPRPPFMTDHWLQGWPRTFVDVYVREAFGGYGQLSHIIPASRAYLVLAGAAALLVAALVTARRLPDAVRARGWELAILAATVVGVVIGVELAHVTGGARDVPAEQGRYFFPAATAVAALAVLALAGLRGAWPRATAAVAVIVMGALALDGRMFYLSATYL